MTTIRDNVVIINCDEIESVEYVQGSQVVTKGQPVSENVKVSTVDGVTTILFRAGRKKSKPVADTFAARIGGNGHAYAPHGGSGGLPKELNFTFTIVVKWKNGNTSTIELGQGSTILQRNNWWIGSTEIKDQQIEINGKSYVITGTSVKNDLEKSFDDIADNVPPKYQPVVDLVGKPLFKELFGAVNVFCIER